MGLDINQKISFVQYGVLRTLALLGPSSEITVLNILKGRRTTTVLFATLEKKCVPYYGLFSNLTIEELQKEWRFLLAKGSIAEKQDKYEVSKSAQADLLPWIAVEEKFCQTDLMLMSDGAYRRIQEAFLLLFQILSYHRYDQPRFIPNTDRLLTQQVLKQVIQENRLLEADEKIIRELWAWLETLTEKNQLIFLRQLDGHQCVPWTSQRRGQEDGLTEVEELGLERWIWQDFFGTIFTNADTFPVLFMILKHFFKKFSFISDTARMTYHFFQDGLSISQIAQKRGLKPSTIQDHLIEIAILSPRFPFEELLQKIKLGQKPKVLSDNPHMKFSEYRVSCEKEELEGNFLFYRLYQIYLIKEGRA